MKKGDVVTIRDGSWTRSVVDGKLIHELLSYRAEIGKKYVVIETGCSFPNTGHLGRPYHTSSFNNTVIQAIESGKVVFIEERMLELVLPKHKVMIDMDVRARVISGNVIEVSDKLYKEIKRDSRPK